MLLKTQTLYYYCVYLQSIVLETSELNIKESYDDLMNHIFEEYLFEFKTENDKDFEVKEFENDLITIDEMSNINVNNDSEANLKLKYQQLVVRMNKLLFLMKNIKKSWNHNFKFLSLINKFI